MPDVVERCDCTTDGRDVKNILRPACGGTHREHVRLSLETCWFGERDAETLVVSIPEML